MTATALPLRAARAPSVKPSASERDAVRLSHVSKSFRSVQAVRDLSLTVGRGQTTALLGPNGAGKTTTIAMILGLLAPDSGRVSVLGAAPEASAAAGRVGAMLQDGGMMHGVRVAELLAMLAAQYRDPLGVDAALSLAQLEGLEKRRVEFLSGGQAQRLRLAVAVIGNPDLLILDEPTSAMDVEARRRFWRAMNAEAARGRTILFSTHHLEEADANSDRILVMSRGRLLAEGSPEAIKESVGTRALRFSMPAARSLELDALPAVTAATVRGDRVEIRSTDTDATLRAVLRRWPVAHDIEIAGIGLEDAFVALTEPAANVPVTSGGDDR